MTGSDNNNLNGEDKQAKIAELQDIIATAEETILSARRLLANLQPELASTETMPLDKKDDSNEEGQVIYGFFDGQIMIGDDGKQYPVPANYASKSKLVEGDKLKLTITPNNRFVYKQIGPVQRNYLIGLVKQDEKGNFTIQTKEKEYKVLLAAATYFKIEPGDEVTLIVPQNGDTAWGAIENVLQKNTNGLNQNTQTSQPNIQEFSVDDLHAEAGIATPEDTLKTDDQDNLTAIEKLEREVQAEKQARDLNTQTVTNDPSDEWESNIEKLKQEADAPVSSNN